MKTSIYCIEAWFDTDLDLDPNPVPDDELDKTLAKLGVTETDYYGTLKVKIPVASIDDLRNIHATVEFEFRQLEEKYCG